MVVKKGKRLSVTTISEEHYEILGIDSNASEDDIKKAFRKLALQYHPDRNSDDEDAEKKFIAITEAYNIIESEGFGYYGVLGLSSGSDVGDAERAYNRIYGDIIEDPKFSDEEREQNIENIKKALEYFRNKVGYKNQDDTHHEGDDW